MGAMTEEQLEDLVESLESGSATEPEMSVALIVASAIPDADALAIDPFQGDFEETSVISDKMVKARKVYADHWTGMPISIGERHRCLRERGETELITTRHSMLSLWLMDMGADPSCLRPALSASDQTKEK